MAIDNSTFDQLLVLQTGGDDHGLHHIPVVLNADLLNTGYQLTSKVVDLEHLRQLATDRPEWSRLTRRIVEVAQATVT